mmetsp:Transcript_22967/g.54200  ORF Transcript_22967/g.54200 Transcript_22967/m.54200 type:complete len:254 (+) Transcript_22967:90-851(+)
MNTIYPSLRVIFSLFSRQLEDPASQTLTRRGLKANSKRHLVVQRNIAERADIIHVRAQFAGPLYASDDSDASEPCPEIDVVQAETPLAAVVLTVQHVIQFHKSRVQILDHVRGVRGHSLGVQLELRVHVHAINLVGALPLRFLVGGKLVVFDKCVPSVQLLELWEESRRDIPRPLQGAEQRLYRFLPCLNVGSARGGQDLVCRSEALVCIYFCNNVERFHHNKVIFRKGENGRNLLADQRGGRRNVIVGKEVN